MSVRVRDDPGVIWGDPQSLRLRTYPLEVINCMLFLYLNLISNLYMQYLFNIHCLIVCLTINYFNRMKPVREGERHSRRKLGLSPEFKAEDLPVRTRHPKVLIQARGISTCTSRGYDS